MQWNVPTRAVELTLVLSSILLLLNDAPSQTPTRDMEKEKALYSRLQSISEGAIPSLQEGTAAMDREDFNTCTSKFEGVLKLAPKFDPAMRRLGYCLVATGKRDEGLAMIQAAVDTNRSFENLISLAVGRVDRSPGHSQPSEDDMGQALKEAEAAEAAGGENDPQTQAVIAELSLRLGIEDKFRSAVNKLKALEPDAPYTHFYNSIALADASAFDAALVEVDKARALGIEPQAADSLQSDIERARDEAYPLRPYVGYIYGFLALCGAWIAGLVVLFVAGRLMSQKTLAIINDLDPGDVTAGGHKSLKARYKRLITVAGLYYYISQPVLIVLVIVVTAAIILGCFFVGVIPIKLVLLLGFASLASIFYIFKSLLIRPKIKEVGEVLPESDAPALWSLVRSVAAEIGTRSVDEIRLGEGCEVAVYERGSFRQKMRDQGERVLILGVGTLDGFGLNAFRAVLAHEYGHFSNRDTAGGDIAYRVNTDIERLAEAMVQSGTNSIYNLTFHFVRFYHFIFRRITHGASRLQEVLADRMAAFHFGSAAFKEGLEHVIRREVEFTFLADAEIRAALGNNRALESLYDLRPDGTESRKEIDEAIVSRLDRQTTDEDTHPGPSDRFRLVQTIEPRMQDTLQGNVWDLFDDPEKLKSSMTARIQQRVFHQYRGADHELA